MEYLVKPWDHQIEAIRRARLFTEYGLFFEMGTGKTATTINICREHYAREKRLMRTLILGPLITVDNWKKEFKLHSKIKDSDVITLRGKEGQRVADLNDHACDPKTQTHTVGKIFITNYEAMEMPVLHSLLCCWQPEILICDESHRLKSIQSVRAKKVIQLLGEEPVIGSMGEYTRAVKHVYILTGTPILNTAMDIFNQYRILDSGKTFGLNYYEFRGMFFEDSNRGMPSNIHFPKWLPRADTYEILHKKIYSKGMRVLKEECLDLPPLIRQRLDCTMSAEQTKLYNEMKRDYITWVKEHEHSTEPRAVVAQMALTKILRLQQIVSGFVKTEDQKEIPLKIVPRLRVLTELLVDLTPEHKVIVWATFKQNYKQIAAVCKEQKIDYVELHGDVSHGDRIQNLERFRTDPKCRVIIANQGAAGIGINLTEASYSIFYSRSFSLEHDLQAESRNHRGGSEIHSKITRVDLVCKDTVDELILEALAAKQNIAQQVLDWKL